MTKERFEKIKEIQNNLNAINFVLEYVEIEQQVVKSVRICVNNQQYADRITGEVAEDIVKKLEEWKKALEVEFERL